VPAGAQTTKKSGGMTPPDTHGTRSPVGKSRRVGQRRPPPPDFFFRAGGLTVLEAGAFRAPADRLAPAEDRDAPLDPPLLTAGLEEPPDPPLRAFGFGALLVAPLLLTVGLVAAPDLPLRAAGGADLDTPLLTVEREVAPDPPLREEALGAGFEPPLRTVGRALVAVPPPRFEADALVLPLLRFTRAEGLAPEVRDFGRATWGVVVLAPPVVRVTEGCRVPVERGGVTTGRPGSLGLVIPVLPGLARCTPGFTLDLPFVPPVEGRAAGCPGAEPPGRLTAPRSTPGAAVPGALPPERFGETDLTPLEVAPALG
jgi:hypothetical protein